MSQLRDSHLPTVPPDTRPTHPPTESSRTREVQPVPPTESHPHAFAPAGVPQIDSTPDEGSTRYVDPLAPSEPSPPRGAPEPERAAVAHTPTELSLSLEADPRRTGTTTLLSKPEGSPRDVNTTQRSQGQAPQSVRVVRDEARMQRLEEQFDLLDARVRLLVKSAERTRVWLIASNLAVLVVLLLALLR